MVEYDTEDIINGHIDLLLGQEFSSIYGLASGGEDLRFIYTQDGDHRILPYWIDDKRIMNGAWFGCCDINDYTQYHGPAATYYTNLRPNAIRYTGHYDRTYFVYGDFSRDPAIQYYDHTNKTLSVPVICGRTQIPGDAHGNPSILIDDDGYIYVFFGCHHHAIQMVKSVLPEDINDWSAESTISTNATYPQPYMLAPGRIILSFRQKAQVDKTAGWVYTISTDGDQRWGRDVDLIYDEKKYIYAITEIGDETPVRTFHIAFNPFDYYTNFYTNIYYIHSDDNLRTFKTRSGLSTGDLPIRIADAELVFDSGQNSSHVNDMILDNNNSPLILFNTGPWNKVAMPGDGEWRVARLEESQWMTCRVAPCDHLFDRGCLAKASDGHFIAYLPVNNDYRDGGEMMEYRSDDGGVTWHREIEITTDSEYSHNYAVRVRNAHPEFRTLWSYGCSDITYCPWIDQPSEVFLYGDDGFINSGLCEDLSVSVRVEGVPAGGDLYMYCGNPGGGTESDMGSCLMNGYSGASDSVTDSMLALEWLIDMCVDTVIDHSGNGNDGYGVFTLDQGGSTPGRRYDLAMPGSIMHLSGADYLQLDDWNGQATMDSLTLEIWFRCDNVSGVQPLVNKWNGSAGFNLFLEGGIPTFMTGAGGYSGGQFHTPHIVENVWHHISAVYDGNELILYLDGRKSKTSYYQLGSVPMPISPLTLGKLEAYYFKGDIDEFRIYSRALSGEEVRSHYMKKIFSNIKWTLGDMETFIPEGKSASIFFSKAWPNPFNDQVNMEFYAADDCRITAELFDVAGRRVRTLVRNSYIKEGYHPLYWDGSSEKGVKVTNGVYFCRISTLNEQAITKLVMLR